MNENQQNRDKVDWSCYSPFKNRNSFSAEMRHSPTNERGWIVAVKVLDVEKRKAKEHSASKNYYEFLLKVKWSDEDQYCIFRRYSMFFDLQAGLRQLFQQKQNIVIPDLPVARLAQAGGMLFGAMVKKQCKNIDEFCQKVIQLPPVVSQSDIVLQFFSQWGTDAILSKPISPPSPPTGTGKDEEQIVERYRSVAIFNASGRGEMSLRENEPVTVIEKNHTGWWLVANLKGEHGFAPATFLEPVEGTRHAGEKEWRDVEDDDRMWVAVESYTAQCEDELSYKAGDDVEVLATSNLGWWKIRIRGSVGLTPGSNLAPKPKNDVTDTYATERRERRSSYSSISGIYASIRSPPPRRESSLGRAEESRKKVLVSRSASTPHALEYATVEIVPSPTQKSPQFDFDDSNNVPEYATVIPKHLRAKPRSRSMSETGGELKRSLKAKHKGSPELPRSPPTALSRRFLSVDNDDDDFSDPGYSTVRDIRPASVNYRTRVQSFADDDITRLTSRKYVNVASSNHVNNTIGQHFVAITNFSPPSDRPEDLALAAGETVRLLSEDGVWAFVCTVDPTRRRGWVPSSLLKIKGSLQEPTSNRRSLSVGDITDAIQREETEARKNRQTKPPVPSPRSDLGIKKATKNHPAPPEGEAPPLPGVPSNQKDQANINASYFVIEDFTTSHPNCISVRAGEVGQLLEATPTGWWKMNVDGVIGWTPRDFWSLREDPSSSFGDELWFYGKLSRQKCEEIMMKNSRELDYLVRESAQKFASFVLSVKYGGKIRHFPIEVTRSGRYVIGKHAFDGLTEIVSFYKTNALFYTPAKEPVSLGQPFRGS